MNAVVGVLDGSCTACDGAAAGTCSAATCESNFHTFVNGVGCSSCAEVMDDVVGVVDGSCTACDGDGAASSCSAASCESNSHTFVDGAGCTVDCATTGGGAACPSTTTTVSATIYPSL